jgi:hypothetical protein
MRVYQNHKEAKKAISRIIQVYNQMRPHEVLIISHQIKLTCNKAVLKSDGSITQLIKNQRR